MLRLYKAKHVGGRALSMVISRLHQHHQFLHVDGSTSGVFINSIAGNNQRIDSRKPLPPNAMSVIAWRLSHPYHATLRHIHGHRFER